ncbi:alcohol dehydrogenase catalytic domain-containing protein [Sphingomonas sp. VDB2]|uniref:alcohol dehydrogenase catalytic domain-containing protein n=1 Tax=Sphingomonas sp. VDB2 TaxID=3228751 RepID=UPI003A809801
MRGVVWDGAQLHITKALSLRPIRPGEVRVRVLRSGICHSDIGMMAMPQAVTPMVLGHEAAGEVMEVGPGVEGWSVGDRVAVGTQTPCGQCRECGRDEPHNCDTTWGYVPDWPFLWEGRPVASFANVSSFAGEILVKAGQLFAIHDLPPEQGALIGCAVSTGACAARVLGRVKAGDRVAVFGIGGIGVNAVQGARLAGAEVLAIDRNPSKEAVARQFGAAHFHVAQPGQDGMALAQALAVQHGPIDVAIECSGAIGAVEAALHCPKRGGRTVLIGLSAPGTQARLSLDAVLGGREIISTMNGGARPGRDYPTLIEEARTGRLNLRDQISHVWPLEQVEDAIAALKAGAVTRAVLDHMR